MRFITAVGLAVLATIPPSLLHLWSHSRYGDGLFSPTDWGVCWSLCLIALVLITKATSKEG